MPSKKGYKRVKNWRASRKQEFCSERFFRKIEDKFWNYNRIKQAVFEKEEEMKKFYSSSSLTSTHTVGNVSDPTQRLALELTEGIPCVEIKVGERAKKTILRPKDWITVVDQTLLRFAKDSPIVKEVLYRRYIRNEGSARTWMDLEINSDKYYKARNVGLQYARECAIQLGLLKAFEPPKEPLRQPLGRSYEANSY